jgi:hypothetical protein
MDVRLKEVTPLSNRFSSRTHFDDTTGSLGAPRQLVGQAPGPRRTKRVIRTQPSAGPGAFVSIGTPSPTPSNRFCRGFCSGEVDWRIQLLSTGAGECIFLRNLRTSPGSPILKLQELERVRDRLISNPSPPTEIPPELVTYDVSQCRISEIRFCAPLSRR